MMGGSTVSLLSFISILQTTAIFSSKEVRTFSLSSNFRTLENKQLIGYVVKRFDSPSLLSCGQQCMRNGWCTSTNYKMPSKKDGKGTCELNKHDIFLINENANFHDEEGVTFSMLLKAPCELHPCQNGGTCHPGQEEYDFTCSCLPSFGGKRCEKSYKNNSCSDLFNAGFTKNGVYQIQSQEEVIDVYCDQSSRGGGWTMVFKAVSSLSTDIYKLWSSADTLNENKTEVMNTNSSLKEHYKNRLVQNWVVAKPKEARVALYKNGSEILSIVFDATESCSENWFSRDRIIHSPWNDLYTEPIIIFSIRGQVKRAFDIARNHGGCWKDAGWLMVSSDFCHWEERLPKRTIMYSNITSYTQWKKIENVGIADVLLVYIR